MTRKKSALHRVRQSGLELVAKRKRRGRLATVEGIAKIKFKAWKRSPGMGPQELIPSADVMNRFGISARIAYAIMLQPKEKLMAMHQTLDHEHVDSMMADLLNSGERLKELIQMIEAAYLRVLSAASAYSIAGDEFLHQSKMADVGRPKAA